MCHLLEAHPGFLGNSRKMGKFDVIIQLVTKTSFGICQVEKGKRLKIIKPNILTTQEVHLSLD